MTGAKRAVFAAMEGAGYYNRHSSLQAAGIRRVLPLWRQVAATIEIGHGPVVIADYGSSQGRNSMAPIRVAIEEVRARVGADRPIQVFHTDLPVNDFTSLFQALDEEPDSYLLGDPGVYPAAVGRSYFEPVLPPGSVQLGWNSWTLHWMSRKPVDVPDHVWARLSANPEVRNAAALQSAEDWRRFLAARAVELRPGARLLCLIIVRASERPPVDRLGNEVWAAVSAMGAAGLLDERECLAITVPTHVRTLPDLERPFADGGGFAGLRLERLETVTLPDPFWERLGQTGDVESYAESWAGMARAIYGPTILAALGPDRDRPALVDELLRRFAGALAAAPGPIDFNLAVVVLTKTG